MADFRAEAGIGTRIRMARRQRGFRTTRDLADTIPGGNVTEAVLENIESGRKADLSVSQLLNIARGLNVPLSMLLAPMGRPDSELDLPNLSDEFAGMTAAEFDCWLSATPASSYRPRTAREREDIALLTAIRELGLLERELDRLRMVVEVETASGDPDLTATRSEVQERIARLAQESARIATLLKSSGVAARAD
ncbi:transcriptional regulator with XRE-family HTH domain [Leifsonia sp. EB41]|uniref:helix-turn-helix domain-containing protein n=1 Tax=Leifsonia sp. EB41 TaxID=3156260 RepID=UPI0035118D40